ncbi:MAG: C-terminal binding protein [Rhodobiaceae bacterium]|nr:C-terminal binding protein [Rhodobiaceae bacterium]MCC0014034.1 C-terminal binding protein [Rhodobiaceae bacterium]MCC0060395.1 C-terminal binding protein [Rhodobiaceae bacterium]
MKIVRTDRELECPHVDAVLRERGHDLVLLPDGIGEDELVEATRDADLILMCYTPVTVRVIEGAKQLRAIVKYGVGIDAIDIDAAKTHRVPVVNVPEYAEETVAEGAFALMIALAKKLVPLDRTMHRDGWAWPQQAWLTNDIAGKTLGLVGVGRIGRSMARMAGQGFRARVLGYDPNVTADTMRALGVEKVDDLHAMLKQCDLVSVHCTLSDQTRHLIGASEFAAMKPSAIFINVSRGALVDEIALLIALKEKRIAGAGLDVFSQEPLALEGHPLSDLFGMDNVILMPHLTFYTHEAMRRLEDETLERCFEALEGRPVLVKSKDPRLTSQTHGVTFTP